MNAEKLAEVVKLHGEWIAAGMPCGDSRGANLRGASLRGADLREANVSWADLREANLREANLRGANLRGANLRGADLRGASLRGADLREANVSWADLREAKGGEICRVDFGGWSICIRATETIIGCQVRKNDKWLSWSSESPEIAAMHGDAPEWWRVHGDAVKACIRCVMAKAGMEVVT